MITACGGNGYEPLVPKPPAVETLQVVLTSDQQSPSLASAAIGMANLTLDRASRTISATITLDGISATAAHIHAGEVGAHGPITFSMTISGNTATLAPTVLTPEQLATLDAGGYYFNVHSADFPDGEVRGQIGREVFASRLTGSQFFAAPVQSAGEADAFLALDPRTSVVTGRVTLKGTVGTEVQLRVGAFGQTGAVLVPLTNSSDHVNYSVPTGYKLSADDIAKLRAGGLYLRVITAAHPGGELRGQLGRRVLLSSLDGTHQVPSTGSFATGRGFAVYDPATRKLAGGVQLTGMDATSVHLHQGVLGQNGVSITAMDKLDGPSFAINSTATALTAAQAKALLTGGTYYNARSAAFPDGELRGQLHPVASDAAPLLKIVSPVGGATLARGEGLQGAGSFNGAGFSINLEVITRDGTGIAAVEGLNVRDASLLGKPNPNLPTLEVSIDADMIKPDGTLIPAGTNLAPLFNIAGSDDTPGTGVTLWAGWHVLESLRADTTAVTIRASIRDKSGRVATDVVNYRLANSQVSGQALTPNQPGAAGDGVDDADGPVVTMTGPRPGSSVSTGPLSGLPTPPSNASLMFIQVSALDKTRAGIAVNENGEGKPDSGRGTIPDGTQIGVQGPNRNFPGLFFTFDVPLRQPNGNLVPAGQNLAPLFNIVGSELSGDIVRTTAAWVVGGTLVVPPGKQEVTAVARVTDNNGRSGSTTSTFGVSAIQNGQSLTPAP